MSEFVTGTSGSRVYRVLVDGVPSDAATLTYTLTGPTGTALLTAEPAVLQGDGWYLVTLDGTTHLSQPGLYRERWSGTVGGEPVRHDGVFRVVYPDPTQLTLLELRHMVADQLNDLTLGRVESATGLSITDSDRIEPDDHWRGAYLYLYAGPSRGDDRIVSASDESSTTLTVGKDFSVTPTSDTYYELHERWRVSQYNRAINLAILQRAREALSPVVDETVTLTTDTVEYTIPAGFHFVTDIWRLGTSSGDDWRKLDRNKKDYEVVTGQRLLRVQAAETGERLRILGQVLPDQLTQDGQIADLPADYVVMKAAAHLLAGKIGGPQVDRDASAQKASLYYDQAEREAPKDGPLGNAVRL